MNKTVLITGATSGIGLACARLFAAQGWQVVATGRRADRLQALADETGASTLCFDVTDRQATLRALDSLLPDRLPQVVINNAGKALGLDSFEDAQPDDWEDMIDTNIKGLLTVGQWAAQHLQPGSHIVNVGSIAGREVYPKGHVYCGTKHAVDAITRGMRIDLLPRGIKVSQVAPGMVETEFSVVRFHGDEARASSVYEGVQPLSGEDVATTIHWMVTAPAHVNVADVLLLPAAQGASTVVLRNK